MIKQQLINPHYQHLADEIEHYFAQSTVILQAQRNIIKTVVFEGETLVVKAYKRPHFINRLIYTYFRKSKAWRAYEYGLKIAKFTPNVIARIEHYTPFLGKSYLICQQFEPDFNMQAPLFKNHPDKITIFKQFARFVFELHQSQIIHQDLSPGNILIKKTSQNYQFQIIDINRMIFKKVSRRQAAKNFNKLWANDEDLRIILKTYAKIAQFDDDFINQGLGYNQQNKNRKTRKANFKKILGL